MGWIPHINLLIKIKKERLRNIPQSLNPLIYLRQWR
jgi:hypothetical protein